MPEGRIGLLGTDNAPFCGYLLRALGAAGLPVDCVLLDAKRESEKMLAVHEERTGGRQPPLPLAPFGVPLLAVENHNSAAAAEIVRARGVDLLVVAGSPRILKGEILTAARRGVVNCHPGLLPEFRGCTCVEWAVHLDEQVGNTAYFLTEAIDAGPILLREGLVFAKSDDYAGVRCKVHEAAWDLLARACAKVYRENLSAERLPRPGEGRYFKPMDDATLLAVKEKLRLGRYAFQR